MAGKSVKYKILEHKADLKIRVFGRDKEGLFLNAMLAMEECMRCTLVDDGREIKRKISVQSQDEAVLLADFLSEVLYQIQSGREIYLKARIDKLTDKELIAELSGRQVEGFGEDIKAVTYHDLDVQQRADGLWEATILFDV